MGFLDELLKGAADTASRAYDQVNPFDGGKNWNQRTAAPAPKKKPAPRPQPKPYNRPADLNMVGEELLKATNTVGSNIGGFLFDGSAKLANQGFGVVENLGANLTGNQDLIRKTKQHVDQDLLAPGKGLFGKGGIYQSTDALHNAKPKDVLVKAGGTGLQSLAETLPIKGGEAIIKGASPAFNKIMQGTALGLGQGAAYSTGSQLSKNGKVDGSQLAFDTATSGLIGGGLPLAGKTAKVVGPAIKKQAQIAARKSEENLLRQAAQGKILTRVEPHYIQPSNKQLDQGIVSQKRAEIINGNIDPIIVTQNKEGFMKVLDGEHRLQAYLELGVPQVPTRVVTPGEVKMMKQGGYIGGPQAKGFADAEKNGRVFDGVDGKKRFEATDREARLVSIGDANDKLENLLTHPTLYDNYPQLKNLPVDIKIDKKYKGNEKGQFTPEKGIEVFAKNHAEAKETLIHELQHAIQKEEGFSGGGAPIDNYALQNQLAKDQLKKVNQQLYAAEPNSDAFFSLRNKRDELIKAVQSSQDQYGRVHGAEKAMADYKNLAGEAEARAVAARRNMTDEERVSKQFYDSLDVPKKDLIVRNEGGVAKAVPKETLAMRQYLEKRGVPVNDDNTVTVYHVTSADNAKSIQEQGLIKGNTTATGGMTGTKIKPAAFVGYDKADVMSKWGNGKSDVLEIKVPVEDVRHPAQDLKQFYFEGGLKRDKDGVWRAVEKQNTFVNRIAERDYKPDNSGPMMSINDNRIYTPTKAIRQAENDFADGKISANQLETIRQKEATRIASPKKAQLPVRNQTPSTKLHPKTSKVSSTSKLNTNRISLTEEAKSRLDVNTNEVIGRLSNKEVQQFAKAAGMQTKGVTIDGTKKKIAEQLNLRNEIYSIEQQIVAAKKAGKADEALELMKKSAELGRTSRSQGTDLGRQLAARRIIADVMATPQQRLFRLFDEAGVDADTYTKRLADVDMNNADEVMKAYRDLVPAKFSDWLDKYRYTNMLSSPLTHIVNIASNTQGLLGIAPVEKAFAGAVDATRAALTGTKRTRFASESGAYTKASIKSAPQAMRTFADIMTGKKLMEMPDADALKQGRLATSGIAGVADNILSIVPKFLEATDQATMTMARAGEKAALNKRISKGVEVTGDIDGKVNDASLYRVFRQDLSKEGEGYVLNFMDGLPEIIKGARNSKSKGVATIAKFTFPFVQTIANIAKQGVEYSPVGITTLPGHADKTGQAAKVAMGSTVTALVVGAFAAKDAITFSEPSDAKSRDAFRAEGKQPYAVKIGDKWVNYSKLHPAIAFNFAIVGAVKDAQDKNAIDQPTADKIMNMAGSVMGYFRDQSFMKGVGDFTSALEVKDGASYEDAIATIGSNWGNQLVPFKSMVSWIGRQIDPTQRKTDYGADMLEQIRQNMVKDIPGLNSNVPIRENPYYKDQSIPITNDNPFLNSFSPNRITNDRGYGNTTGLNVTQRREMAQLPDADKSDFRQNAINEKFKKKQEKEIAEKNGTTTAKGKKTEVAKGLDKSYAETIAAYDKLSADERDKKFYKENDAEYKYEKARYENKKASGTLSMAETIKAEEKLAKLEVGSKFSKETRDLYSLSKKQLTALIDGGKLTEKQAEQILAYGDALKGIDGYNKFKDKNGNVAFAPKARGGSRGGRRNSGGRKGTGKGGKSGTGSKRQLPSDDRTSTISLVASLSKKAANTKVAKRALPKNGGISAPGIKAYKKVAKTNVSMTRKA